MKLVTLNIKTDTKTRVAAYKKRDFIHSEDEAIKYLLNLAEAYEKVLFDLKKNHIRLYNHYRLQSIVRES